jgi:predicted permease
VCPAAGIGAALAAAGLLGLEGLERSQLLLFGALPPAVLNYMLAERFDQEPAVVASIVLLGNLGSVIVVPLMLALVL